MTDESPKPLKPSKSMGTALTVMATLLIVSGFGLFWVAWRGIDMLRHEGTRAASAAAGNSAALAGKTDYIGTWTGGHETLTIDPNGHADWSETRTGSTESMHGTVTFEKDTLVVDAIITKKSMHIDRAPHQDGKRVLMTLDSAELEKQ